VAGNPYDAKLHVAIVWNGGMLFYNRNFLLPSNVRGRSTDRLPLYVTYRCNYRNWVQNLGATPIKIWGPQNHPFWLIFHFASALHWNGPSYRQSKNNYYTRDIPLPESEGMVYFGPNEIPDCGSFAPILRFVFQSFHKVTR